MDDQYHTPPSSAPHSYEPTQAATPSPDWYVHAQQHTAPPPVYPYGSGGDYPPHRPTHTRWFIIIGAVALVVVLVGALLAVVIGQNNGQAHISIPSGQATQSSAQAEQPTRSPISGGQPTSESTQQDTSTGDTHKIGDSVTIDNWEIRVNSAKTSQGGQFDSLQPGNEFLEISVSLTNQTGQTQLFSSFESFTLKDSSGQTYDQTFASDAPNAPDGNVPAGGKLRGTVVYEVPNNLHEFEFDVTPDPFHGDVAVWSLSV